jgi:hypothetical protein
MIRIKRRLIHVIDLHGKACGYNKELEKAFRAEDKLLEFIAAELDRRFP